VNVPTWLKSQNYRVRPHMMDRDALKSGGLGYISNMESPTIGHSVCRI
jgi:hypothetical protein